jgi:hypothetical protein
MLYIRTKKGWLEELQINLFIKSCFELSDQMYNFIKRLKKDQIKDLANILRYDSKASFESELISLGYKGELIYKVVK